MYVKRWAASKDPPSPQQPVKCKGCIWGNWEAAKQFCSKQTCVRDGETT